MAASEPTVKLEEAPSEPEPEAKPTAVYPVARSTREKQVLNTIDIYGEKPFSV